MAVKVVKQKQQVYEIRSPGCAARLPITHSINNKII